MRSSSDINKQKIQSHALNSEILQVETMRLIYQHNICYHNVYVVTPLRRNIELHNNELCLLQRATSKRIFRKQLRLMHVQVDIRTRYKRSIKLSFLQISSTIEHKGLYLSFGKKAGKPKCLEKYKWSAPVKSVSFQSDIIITLEKFTVGNIETR